MKFNPIVLFTASMIAAFSALSAQARDSTWTLCVDKVADNNQSSSIVVNMLEHRYKADHRITDVTVILGSNIVSGTTDMDSADGSVFLKSKSSPKTRFAGETKIVDGGAELKLTGKLYFSATESMDIDRSLKCDEL